MNKNIIKAMAAGVLTLGLVSCENSEVEFPDYEGGVTVYFAYQTPVRSMMLGIDDLGSTADNDTRTCKIYGTMGGAYNGKNIKVEVAVDNSLCDNLYFDQNCTQPVVAMPSNYYQLAGTTLDYNGDIKGGVDVKLTDAFFADPKACSVNYVIPVVMKSQTGANQILAGELAPGIASANRLDADSWSVQPMDYVLYCVKYVSKYEGYYLPSGTITTTYGGASNTKSMKPSAWENVPEGDILYFQTIGENTVTMPIQVIGSKTVTVLENNKEVEKVLTREYNGTLALNFNGASCTATSEGDGVWKHQEWIDGKVVDVTDIVKLNISGNGTYTELSDKYLWAAKKRNGLQLDVKAEWAADEPAKYEASLDMALQRRGQGNTVEEFTVTLKK